jgi:hypothetical protein
MAPEGFAADLISTFEFVHDRFTGRLASMTDEEYCWEPVAGCWSVRPDARGRWLADGPGADGDGDEPVTTIAWRVHHLACHALGGFASWLRDGGAPYDGDPDVPHTADGGRAALARNWARWHEGMTRLTASRWLEPIGEQFGPHRDASTASLVLHVLDEYVHHAAEVSLLRDLYRDRS